ncbi:MAG: Asp-tRNA(Asn)/Glu-tRNA(Gln) amidotransferase subunit GatA [Tissierellia bacterium]|nr:Asp-tRNA(Asn)/Glu-tRNA(Gln) amidotransferase subunit GatA [Tissierellia bacterium]
MNILDYSAIELVDKIKSEEISALEVVNEYIGSIEKSMDLNVFISTRFESAREEAAKVDERIKKGEKLGALAGLPIVLKDNIVVKDEITTCGSKMLENFNSPYSSTVYEKIVEADGIVLGKANMDEFAMGSTTRNSYFGPTKNPLNADLIPGGSSGGSAAAIAANNGIIAVGSDTGGSVRQPASFCGVVGIKPTYGSISRFGVVSMANTFDQVGTMGRNVKDAAILLNTLIGTDENDSTALGNKEFKLDFNFNDEEYLKNIKIAIPSIFMEIELEAEVKAEFEKAIEILKANGVEVKVVETEYLKYSTEVYHLLANGEISYNLSRFDGIRYGYRSEKYTDISELYKFSRSEAFGDEVKKRIMVGTYIMSQEASEEFYKKGLKLRTLIKNEIEKIFEDYDFILSPTSSIMPFAIDSDISNIEIYKSDIFTVPTNIFGGCGMSVPMPKLENGLSVGIHFMGNRFDDANLIKMGIAFEGLVK